MLNGDGSENDKKPSMSNRKKNNFTLAAHFFCTFLCCCCWDSLRKQPTFGDATTGFPTK